MAIYQSKSVTVEAFRMGIDPIPDWFQDLISSGDILAHTYCDGVLGGDEPIDQIKVFCLIGHIRAENGDYIVQAPNGEIFVRPPEFFEKGYVLIDPQTPRKEKAVVGILGHAIAFWNYFFPKNEGELLPKTDLRIPMPPVKPLKDEESGDAIAPYQNTLLFPIYLDPCGETDERIEYRFDVLVFPSDSEMYRFARNELGCKEEFFVASVRQMKKLDGQTGELDTADPLLGCFLFCHPYVNVETVVHESTHAALLALRRLNCLDIGEKPNQSEERLAELVSSFAAQISDKLHEYGVWF